MKEILKRGATSNILRVFLQDSASASGAGKTGLTNASSGLIISTIADVEATATTYTSAASNVETITTLGTFAAPSSGKCRFKEIDSTNFPGVYEIQIADARFSVANSTQLLVSIQCTGVSPVFAEYQFVLVDLLDSVRLGLTALPNVASGSAGAIITSGTGTAQLSVSSGEVTVATNNDKTGYSLSSSQTFSTTGSVQSVTNAVTVGTINANAINAASIATDAIDADAIASSAVTEIQSGLSTLTSGQVENAVWDATMSSHTGSTTYGGRIVRAANSNVTAFITGSNHIAADIHELQPGVISDADYEAGSTYEKLGTLIEADTPSGYHFTTQALEQAPSSWVLNTDQTTGLKRMISAVVGVGGETATPGVLEFDMVGESTTLRITQSTDGNDRLTVEEV